MGPCSYILRDILSSNAMCQHEHECVRSKVDWYIFMETPHWLSLTYLSSLTLELYIKGIKV